MHTARLRWERAAKPTAPFRRASSRSRFHVGCSGWFYWHLNASFYSWPTIATVEAWMRQIGRRKFVGTVKAPELITHIKGFSGTRTPIRDFGDIADRLGERMGCFLFQLPPSFHYTRARLDRIVSQLDPARRNVVEFRHRTWWNPRVFDAFRAHGIVFCACSAPRLPDDLVKTADEIYVRRERHNRGRPSNGGARAVERKLPRPSLQMTIPARRRN